MSIFKRILSDIMYLYMFQKRMFRPDLAMYARRQQQRPGGVGGVQERQPPQGIPGNKDRHEYYGIST
jgi:hypothetical protein